MVSYFSLVGLNLIPVLGYFVLGWQLTDIFLFLAGKAKRIALYHLQTDL